MRHSALKTLQETPCSFTHVLYGILPIVQLQADKQADKAAANHKEGLPKAKAQHRCTKEQANQKTAGLAAVILP